MSATGERRSSGRQVVLVVPLLALVHSTLAARPAKDLAERVVGSRSRNGLYRLAYVLHSVVMATWATGWFLRLPDRELYHVRPPWSWLMRLGQLLSLGVLGWSATTVGLARFSGLASCIDLLAGREPPPEPEAQGPPLGPDGQLLVAGPFRFTRHPDNLPIVSLFLLFPRMTVNRAVLAALASLYAVVGSLHEDVRLRAAYGAAFDHYRQAVPFFWPRLSAPQVRDDGPAQ